jgi:hypothetical protein
LDPTPLIKRPLLIALYSLTHASGMRRTFLVAGARSAADCASPKT